MLKLAITALAACAAVMRSVHAQTCDASKSNRERTEDKIVLRCSKYDFQCNVADLNPDGSVIRRDSFEEKCNVIIEPNYYGPGVARCSLEMVDPGTLSYSLGFPPSASLSQSVAKKSFRRYRNNCSASCGRDREGEEAKWGLNTYVRCYGSSNCSRSKCLMRKTRFLRYDESWYE